MRISANDWNDYLTFHREEIILNKEVSFSSEYWNNNFPIASEIMELDDEETLEKLSAYNDLDLIHKFSPIRGNLFSWMQYHSDNKVLVIGTDVYSCIHSLAGLCDLTCVSDNIYDLIFALNKTNESMRLVYSDYYAGINLLDEYDYVIFSDLIKINTFDDLLASSILSMIREYKAFLKKCGKIVFAAENALGLKYWAGCKDDVTGSLWTSLEGYMNETTGNPSLKQLNQIISKSGFSNHSIYYPYPDCWFPMNIYSDDHLPEVGELTKNAFSWEKRLNLFNEVNVWNSIIENDMFPALSNGYLIALYNSTDVADDKIIYTKFSNDRSDDFSIKTSLLIDESKKVIVEKKGLSERGKDHISKLVQIEKKLTEIYKDSKIEIQKVVETNDNAELEYVEGTSLSYALKEMLKKGDEEGFIRLFMDFANTLLKSATADYLPSDGFCNVFGNILVPRGLRCADFTDIDLIVPNVITHNNKYVIIDYEWSFDFPIPINFVIYRSIIYLFKGPRGSLNHNGYIMTKLFDLLGIDEDQSRIYEEMETGFQNYTCMNHIPLRLLCRNTTIRSNVLKSELFLDYGDGFSKNNRYVVSNYSFDKNLYSLNIGINDGLKSVRIDPTDHPCLVRVISIQGHGSKEYDLTYRTNGKKLSDNSFIFTSNDPQIIIPEIVYGTICIGVEYEIIEISPEIAQSLNRFCNGRRK